MSKFELTVPFALFIGSVLVSFGCAHSRTQVATESLPQPLSHPVAGGLSAAKRLPPVDADLAEAGAAQSASVRPQNSNIQLVSAEQPVEEILPDPTTAPSMMDQEVQLGDGEPLELEEVIDSVLTSYPLLQSAVFGRNIAQGELLAANGEFDLKLKADSLNMPLGNYENYRQFLGADQPLYGGGSVFGGYRLGTGNFPVYYGERQTNLGGEFKAGMVVPLAQNRSIDDRRAGLWRSQWEVQAVEPEIRAQLIEFMRIASLTYWNWLAAGQNLEIARDLLENATDRNDGLRIRVERGDAPAIELTDNERLIVSRRTKQLDAERKFQQAAYKLSLFLRDELGQPRVVDPERLPRQFPKATDPAERDLDADIAWAIANRPELRSLEILNEQLNIDLAAARNLSLPQIDAVVIASQDAGNPTDPKKDDKSAFELEGGVVGSVPLQRRKAQGKLTAIQGKLSQVRAKTQYMQDKIVAEVQSASAALNAGYQQLEQAHRSLDLARQMEAAERRKFDLGDSNLLLVNLREQATADAASTEVEARLSYFDAQADYRAALASDIVR